METKLLAGVMQTDTYVRLQVAEELAEYFKKEENVPEDFPELERLIAGLGSWMSSSNSKISVGAMEILGILIQRMGEKFKSHIPGVFPALRERLGDGKDQVRDQAQLLIQQIMRDVVTSPQTFLDRLLESCLVHKNWRVKEQGLVCLVRTLNYFGSGQVSVSRFVGNICNLLSDANSQVRTQAVETVVEIYRHVGVKLRLDLSRRNLPASRMATLTAKFDEIDLTSNVLPVDREEVDFDDDRESVSSCSSNTSARTFGSSRSAGTRSRTSGRPGGASKGEGASGAVDEASFEKAFQDVPHINVLTAHDLERTMSNIEATLGNTRKDWETRVVALKELRAVVRLELLDHSHFVQLLKPMELPLVESLKDLRSQVTREACVTLSCISVVLGSDMAHCAEQVLPSLINLLPNSARVMASSAEVCLKFIIKHTPTHRLLQPLMSQGLASKSPAIRKHAAECVSVAIQCWDSHTLERSSQLLEDAIRKGVTDADSTARKHMRRAFWGYHRHFPSTAQKMLDSFDPQLQKHLSDEKVAMDREKTNGTTNGTAHPKPVSILKAPKKKPPPLASTSAEGISRNSHLQRALTSIANVRSQPSPDAPLSPTQSLGPAIRVQRPTYRARHKTEPHSHKSLRSQSVEDMEDVTPQSPRSPVVRPASRSSSRTGMRPSSRTGLALTKKSSAGEVMTGRTKTSPGGRMCRSAQPSPAHSRETSPTGRSSLPRGLASLTQETLMKVYGAGGSQEDEDDAGSVTSERSTFSITSEVSISPYVRFPNPITDLNELLAMTSSQQWSERRDGIAQLHMMLESERPFSHSDIQKVKAMFKRMFSEPHLKVFGLFLDILGHFMEEHREYLDDWLFLILLRLLHRQGSDMLSSIHYKLAMVLELIRKSFETDQQFHQLCRILIDQTQPMNTKVKVAWLEYFHELMPLLESTDFKDTMETRQAVSKLLQMTSEPKSAEIRKLSQKAITKLIELRPATFTLLVRSVPHTQQQTAFRIMKGYSQELSSSGDEAEEAPPRSPAPAPSPGRRTPTGRRTPLGQRMAVQRSPVQSLPPGRTTPVGRMTPTSRRVPGSRIPAPSPTPSPKASPRFRPKTPQGSMGIRATQSLTPSALRDLRGSRGVSSSTPNMGDTEESMVRSRGSRIPTPSRPSTSMAMNRSGAATPTRQRRQLPPRAASVDPDVMAAKSGGSSSLKRPTSARSLYKPSHYQNGSREEDELSPNSLEHFSFSDLPNLDYGSPDEEEVEDIAHKDHVALILRDLQTASAPKQRHLALQSLLTVTKEHPERCNWEEHFRAILLKLMDAIDEDDAVIRTVSLRVLREILKSEDHRLRDYAELTTLKVLKSFADSDASVSQAAEDLFALLAPALPTESALELLGPMAVREKYPMLLGTIKLMTRVITLSEPRYVESRLKDLVPGILRGYSHSESGVRKASVFCLVAIHTHVGEAVREHLTKLSSSQTKLLNLYIARQQQAASKAAARQNGPKR